MPRVEKTIDIAASQDKIFEIIDDDDNYPKWNIVVNEVTKLGEGSIYNLFQSYCHAPISLQNFEILS